MNTKVQVELDRIDMPVEKRAEPRIFGKHFKRWSRKGVCPGCGADCGFLHTFDCPTRQWMLSRLKLKKGKK